MGCSEGIHGIWPVHVEEDTRNTNLSFKVNFSVPEAILLYSSCTLVDLNPEFIEVCLNFSL